MCQDLCQYLILYPYNKVWKHRVLALAVPSARHTLSLYTLVALSLSLFFHICLNVTRSMNFFLTTL